VSDPITFAGADTEDQFYGGKLWPLARQIVLDAAEYAFQRHGWIFVVTSCIRSAEEDAALGGSGLHVAGRAVDLSVRGVTKTALKDVNLYVNGTWEYDPSRPNLLVWFDKKHGTGPHVHVQVSIKTKKRKEA
jgi:hypothetical protein